MIQPKISVCIACYNHEDYIGAAIESVLNQTFQDFELVICNNGSTDNSLKIIESYKDERIKVESVYPNKQSTWAGNNCIERSKGEYVALLCSDDLWERNKLKKQAEYLDNNPSCAAVFTRCQPIDAKGEIIKNKNNPYYKQFNIMENRLSTGWLRDIWNRADHSFCCSSAMIRKTCLDEAGNFDIRLKNIQDMNLWANILTNHEVYIIDEKLTCMRYFPSGTNLSAFSFKTLFNILNESIILYEQFCKIKDINKFLQFMPETKERFKVIDEKYIPFYLAILTLEKCNKVHFKQAALKQLQDFMANEENRELLEKNLNFTHMDLYKISENFYFNIAFKNIFNHIGIVVRFLTGHLND